MCAHHAYNSTSNNETGEAAPMHTDKKTLLADIRELTVLLRELTGLTSEVRTLLDQGILDATQADLSPQQIASASGLTPEAITAKLEATTGGDLTSAARHHRAMEILEWPADALRRHRN